MTDLADVVAGQNGLIHLLLAQQALNNSLAASIADLYARIGNNLVEGIWAWTDFAQAGQGQIHVAVLTGNERHFSLSEFDEDDQQPDLSLVTPGTTLVLYDEPGGQVTAFRQYVIATKPQLDNGRWSFDGARVATFGNQDIPLSGTSIKVLLG